MKKNFLKIRKQDPFMNFCGGLWLRTLSKNKYEFTSKITNDHIDSLGRCENGFISTLIDAGLGAAAQSCVLNRFNDEDGQQCITISLGINFLNEVKNLGFLVGTAKVTKKTKNFIFMSSNLYFKKKKVAYASGIWKIKKGIK